MDVDLGQHLVGILRQVVGRAVAVVASFMAFCLNTAARAALALRCAGKFRCEKEDKKLGDDSQRKRKANAKTTKSTTPETKVIPRREGAAHKRAAASEKEVHLDHRMRASREKGGRCTLQLPLPIATSEINITKTNECHYELNSVSSSRYNNIGPLLSVQK